MDAEAVQAMLWEDRAEWEALVAVLDAHPGTPLHDRASPVWTSRDTYAHIARWIQRSTEHLAAYLDGTKLQKLEGTDDEINARWQREDSGLSLDEARERAAQAFEGRISAVQAVPPNAWDEMLEKIARADGAEHYRGHRTCIVPP